MHTPDDPTSTAKCRQTCTHPGTTSAPRHACNAAIHGPSKYVIIANQIQRATTTTITLITYATQVTNTQVMRHNHNLSAEITPVQVPIRRLSLCVRCPAALEWATGGAVDSSRLLSGSVTGVSTSVAILKHNGDMKLRQTTGAVPRYYVCEGSPGKTRLSVGLFLSHRHSMHFIFASL